MKSVLITLGRLNVGGAEMRTLQLLREIQAQGLPVRPTVYVVSGQPGTLDLAYQAAGAELIFGKMGIPGLLDLYRTCKRLNPDVLHVSALLASGFYTLIGSLAGVPVRISHMRNTGYDRNDLPMRLRNSIFRVFLNTFSTVVIGVCDGARLFAGTSVRKWRTVYNGIDLQTGGDTTVDAPNRLDILFLGRLHLAKNPLRALRVIEAVRRTVDGRGALLHFVGRVEGKLGDQVVKEIEARGLQDAVVLHGETDAPLEAIRRSSILLLTSTREGLPGVVLEALSCGLPVVASRIPGVEEIAARTAGVAIVGLEDTDETWADAVLAQAQVDHALVASAFQTSPFQIDSFVKSITDLWGVRC